MLIQPSVLLMDRTQRVSHVLACGVDTHRPAVCHALSGDDNEELRDWARAKVKPYHTLLDAVHAMLDPGR